jgi:hypothetical protein
MRKKTMLQSTDIAQLSIDMICPGTPRNTLIVQLLPNLAIPLLIETLGFLFLSCMCRGAEPMPFCSSP